MKITTIVRATAAAAVAALCLSPGQEPRGLGANAACRRH